MFKILRDGVHHSIHKTYEEACHHARMSAAKDKAGSFIVHEFGDTVNRARYKARFSEGRVSSYPMGVECVH